jgi:hypothetical protein
VFFDERTWQHREAQMPKYIGIEQNACRGLLMSEEILQPMKQEPQ